jgi:prepilin-type processing-associated H-X9-DG protein
VFQKPVSNVTAGLIALSALWLFGFVLIGPCNRPERVAKTKSLNNIKQLAIATRVYSEDYGALPGWVRNPDGRYAHNCWDEQINTQVKAKDAFNNGETGIKSSADPVRRRILTYGLNALLITPPKGQFDGNADFAFVNAGNPPKPLAVSALNSPENTILFAELSTNTPMPGVYGQAPDPKPFTYALGPQSEPWRNAHDGWIDISPRAFIEILRDRDNNPYAEPYGKNADCGIARDLYGGGGIYAFADGHAQFMKIGKTVGLGTTVNGKPITVENCWSPTNTNNLWNPRLRANR